MNERASHRATDSATDGLAAAGGGAAPGARLLRVLLDRLTGVLRLGFWRRPERNLRVCETLSLGSRGFLAVVRYQDQKFLVGGTNQSIAMLAELASPSTTAGRRRAALDETNPED